jgi:hypothetical protein
MKSSKIRVVHGQFSRILAERVLAQLSESGDDTVAQFSRSLDISRVFCQNMGQHKGMNSMLSKWWGRFYRIPSVYVMCLRSMRFFVHRLVSSFFTSSYFQQFSGPIKDP